MIWFGLVWFIIRIIIVLVSKVLGAISRFYGSACRSDVYEICIYELEFVYVSARRSCFCCWYVTFSLRGTAACAQSVLMILRCCMASQPSESDSDVMIFPGILANLVVLMMLVKLFGSIKERLVIWNSETSLLYFIHVTNTSFCSIPLLFFDWRPRGTTRQAMVATQIMLHLLRQYVAAGRISKASIARKNRSHCLT